MPVAGTIRPFTRGGSPRLGVRGGRLPFKSAVMKRRGFTTIDLVVATMLIGMVASIAIPSIVGVRERLAVRHAADELIAAHSLARATAIRYGRVAELHFDAAATRFWIEMDTSATRTGVTDTIGTVRDVSADGLTMTSTQSLVCFDAKGLGTPIWGCPGTAATVVFSRAGEADSVTMTALGKALR